MNRRTGLRIATIAMLTVAGATGIAAHAAPPPGQRVFVETSLSRLPVVNVFLPVVLVGWPPRRYAAALASAGAAIADADPAVADARNAEPDPRYQLGFDIASGIFGDRAFGGRGNTATGPGSLAIRDGLSAPAQRGFNASVQFHLGRRY